MNGNKNNSDWKSHNPRRVLWMLIIILICSIGSVVKQVHAQKVNSTELASKQQPGKQKDEYHRPEPTRPIKPEIPSASRNRPDKVFLEYADSMIKENDREEDYQLVKGNVKFRQMGMWMYCDSAYYFPEQNSMDAFGHVRMEQGDTLFVYADKLFYDGFNRFARLRCGATEKSVRLINRKVKLTTDSLDYDLRQELGWYAFGGELEDEANVLTSVYGEYSPSTKNAVFYHDVVLHGTKQKFDLYTDTLYYNTDTNIAQIETPTKIVTEEDDILTSYGFYNTKTGVAELLTRSKILHTDSLNRTTTLEGDSIVYDPTTRISKVYSYRDPRKRPSPMVITDTAKKATLIGGFGIYNDMTHEAMATEYPLLMEYSRGDTLFLRADTINTWMIKREQPLTDGQDSTWHKAKAYPRARFFRPDIQGVADTIIFTQIDSILRLYRKPIVWSEERQVRGDSIIVHLKDSTADWALIPSAAKMMEHVEEDFYNQLHADRMMMWFEEGTLKHLDGEGSVQTIMLPMEEDSTYNRLVDAESSYLSIDMNKNKLEKLKMWPEVTGNVTPLFLVKKSQKFLPKAEWLGILRPRREWYGDKVVWEDDLGEVPEELEKYFEEP